MAEKKKASISGIDEKLETLIINQALIKTQVEKTNGRVTVLERFMWICLGGAGIFSIMSLPQLINVLGTKN
jgi:hypothetical protein